MLEIGIKLITPSFNCIFRAWTSSPSSSLCFSLNPTSISSRVVASYQMCVWVWVWVWIELWIRVCLGWLVYKNSFNYFAIINFRSKIVLKDISPCDIVQCAQQTDAYNEVNGSNYTTNAKRRIKERILRCTILAYQKNKEVFIFLGQIYPSQVYSA